ncbi:MAG: hypothetical protein Pg6C_02760 [Treponemataceae bacterium]|nr:MAG: hypothetical protein Pg6C_02760 [Treponemataceae bacterium]
MTEQERMNADRAAAKAAALYPRETWREIEERIFIAASREPKSKNQEQVLNKELVQARILKLRGSCIYLLPEVISQESVGEKFPDAVVDGFLTEFKTVTGNLREIEKRFKESRKKAERVFFKVDSPLATDAVKRKNFTSGQRKTV